MVRVYDPEGGVRLVNFAAEDRDVAGARRVVERATATRRAPRANALGNCGRSFGVGTVVRAEREVPVLSGSRDWQNRDGGTS